MEPFFKVYIASWSAACLVALVLLLRNPAAIAICRLGYWHFLAEPWKLATFAACAWLFSASWSYDIYLVWRNGDYPLTWYSNLFASSVIYLAAGLFWNLEWQRGRGVIFSFMREGWPSRPAESAFLRLAGYAAIFALPAIAAVLVFLLDKK